jgi:integrase
MPDAAPPKAYRSERRSLEEHADEGRISEADRQFIGGYLDAFDGQELSVPVPEGEDSYSYRSLKTKCHMLKKCARRLDGDLADADAEVLNEYLTAMLSGSHPDVKDDGYAQNTVRNHAGTLRRLFEYHGTIEKTDIAMPDKEETSVDPTDMFTSEEIDALRDAAPNARDQCILDLLLYTGQRLTAIQTLRIKDVFPEEGRFRLNPEADGLKGAEGTRPLLGATASVKRWLQHHPASDDPEAALITCLPSSSGGTAGEPLHGTQIQRRIKKIGEKVDIDKPVNPHNFRHNFVTLAKRDYGLSDSQIKHLIGHRPDSNVMNTTYSHLTDEEVATNVAVEAGFEESEDESPLSPPVCPTCDEPLPDNARACSMCGDTFTPDAKAAQRDIEDMLYEGRAEAEDDDVADTIDSLRKEIRENPEMKQAILAELLDE